MSAKRMAASTPSFMGWRVISSASSGVLQSSNIEYFSRRARYSGMYRPACRISQMGVAFVGSRLQARRNRSFIAPASLARVGTTSSEGRAPGS
jgi:hypothetical protein